MSVKRPGGLGKNLSALLGAGTQGTLEAVPQSIQTVGIHELLPGSFQPRKHFDEASLQELAQSIRQQGVLQPLVVRRNAAGRFEILAGERRWRASQLAGLTEVPVFCKVVTDEDARIIALVENLQREDLNVLEQARGMAQLMETHAMTHQQVATVLSKSRSAVTNILRLLSLSPDVQSFLEEGELEMGHARALLMLDETEQLKAAQTVMDRKLSVRATEQLVNRIKSPVAFPDAPSQEKLLSVQAYQQHLITSLKTKVEIKPGQLEGVGKVVIHYENEKKLEELMAVLGKL
ncbi:MAG: ParB/RepB/Spo0J family partition protein [Gammaproteobacteria bacterium]|nr:ParB/RepB/Spo0J family partition protein [Gammaproteobacteria bacterium]